MGRDYSELSPFDFECLVRDLLQERLNTILQVFPIGRDGGIDISGNIGEKLITVQCKHSPGRQYRDIKASLVAEAERLAGREVGEYWLATSANLTRKNKLDIVEIFRNHALPEDRILAKLDLDNLLNKYPLVEKRHYKLWITSSGVLENLLRPELEFRSNAFADEMRRKVRLFVQTESFNQARELLLRRRVCILSGPPGVGKTTVAQMLLLELAKDGYEQHIIVEDIAEAEGRYRQGVKQVFLYDDFLGQTTLEHKLQGTEDRRLINFVDQVARSSSHYMILTTREYILHDAQKTYEVLKPSRIDLYKYIVGIDQISPLQRAQILYNHIYFAELPESEVKRFIGSHVYLRLVDSRRFNPRLIEFAISSHLQAVSSASLTLANRMLRVFLRPEELWGHIFDYQLTADQRILLWSVALSPRSLDLAALGATMAMLGGDIHGGWPTDETVRDLIRHLDGSFVRTRLRSQTHVAYVQISVPSLIDHMKSVLDEEPGLALRFIDKVPYFEQVAELLNWATGATPTLVSLVLSIHQGGQDLEQLSDAFEASGRKIVDRLLNQLLIESPGINGAMTTDKRVLVILKFLVRYRVAISALNVQTLTSSVINFWFSTGASKSTAVDIAEAIQELPHVTQVFFEDVLENIAVWLDISVQNIEDHVLRYRFHDTGRLGSQSLANLRDEFDRYARRRLAEVERVDDLEEAIAIVRELLDATPKLHMHMSGFNLLQDLENYYETVLGQSSSPIVAKPRSQVSSTMTVEEIAAVKSMFSSLS